MARGAPGMGEPFAACTRDGRENQDGDDTAVDGRNGGGAHADNKIGAPLRNRLTSSTEWQNKLCKGQLQLILQKEPGSRPLVWPPWPKGSV